MFTLVKQWFTESPVVMVVIHYSHLIDGVLSLDLDIHGDKEGEEEEDAAGEGHQLRGGQLRVWPHPRLNFTILKRSNWNKAFWDWANILQQGMLRFEFLRKQLYPGFRLSFLQRNLSANQLDGLLFRMVLALPIIITTQRKVHPDCLCIKLQQISRTYIYDFVPKDTWRKWNEWDSFIWCIYGWFQEGISWWTS